MANAATGGMYQQMVVPAPYHFPQPQPQPVPQEPKEPKKRKKPTEKANGEKKKPKVIGQSAYMAGLGIASEGNECSKCNKKKCFKHLDAKNKNQMSKKTPEDVVLGMKKHMLKLLSTHEYTSFCKTGQKNGQLDVDISKMHRSYLEEHEPQAFEPPPSNDPNREYKPKVKQWLYRKIFLDEFKCFEYNECKRHTGDLRRSIESVMMQKKKKTPKPKPPAPSPQHQVLPQDYSMNNHAVSTAATGADMNRASTLPPGTIVPAAPPPTHPPATTATGAYQQGNLMTLGGEATSVASTMSGMAATPTLHNSLATYMTQQVQPNILFGLGQQQQQPAQQQPLNLQTSHQGQPMQAPPHQAPVSAAPPSPAPPIPLNLHNPYYVSLGPMLPLPMSTPQHNHQQQFQQNMLQQQQSIPGGFNQHTMYQ